MDAATLVNKIIDSDKHIRFAAIFDNDANIVASGNRPGVTNLLSEEETKRWATNAVNSWKARNKLSAKIGQGQYAVAVYEKLRRVTMPVDQNHLIYVTFDSDGGIANVIQSVLNQKPGADSEGLQ